MKETTAPMNVSAQEPHIRNEWSNIKHRRDLLEVAMYKMANPDSPDREEIDRLLAKLKEEEMKVMRRSPSRYSKSHLEDLLKYKVFEYDELAEEGLITSESWEKLYLNVEYLPDMNDLMKGNVDGQMIPEGTDVYFFGMPSAGKTALMMGIAAANGQGYTVDMRTNGGPYAAALRQYTHAGRTPGRTAGKFVTAISGTVNSDPEGSKFKTYPINLMEMSGEEFALRIADSQETSIANMGTGVTNLLRNDHHKVFFILVDASRPMVKVSYLDREIDEDGEITKYVRSRYISQLDILDKFAVLISLPENQEIMNKVDAIHFIVTKSDSLGKDQEREDSAADMVRTQYLSVVEQLKNYCRSTRRINRIYDYEPQIFTYSLGRFYLGDVFDYDSKDTLKVVEAIREASASSKRFKWRKFVNNCRLFL